MSANAFRAGHCSRTSFVKGTYSWPSQRRDLAFMTWPLTGPSLRPVTKKTNYIGPIIAKNLKLVILIQDQFISWEPAGLSLAQGQAEVWFWISSVNIILIVETDLDTGHCKICMNLPRRTCNHSFDRMLICYVEAVLRSLTQCLYLLLINASYWC